MHRRPGDPDGCTHGEALRSRGHRPFVTPMTTKTSRLIKAEDHGRCFCAFLTSVTLITTVVPSNNHLHRLKSNALNLHSFWPPAGGASSLMVSGVIESNILEMMVPLESERSRGASCVHRLSAVYDPDTQFFCLFFSLCVLLCYCAAFYRP